MLEILDEAMLFTPTMDEVHACVIYDLDDDAITSAELVREFGLLANATWSQVLFSVDWQIREMIVWWHPAYRLDAAVNPTDEALCHFVLRGKELLPSSIRLVEVSDDLCPLNVNDVRSAANGGRPPPDETSLREFFRLGDDGALLLSLQSPAMTQRAGGADFCHIGSEREEFSILQKVLNQGMALN